MLLWGLCNPKSVSTFASLTNNLKTIAMNQELIQYQSERIAALINELKTQEEKYNSLYELGMAFAKASASSLETIKSLKDENNELKQKLENLKK
jgi:chaperonin cofactor prefoldin